MAWGMLAKGAMGAIKGGAKKIAGDKLLGRGKKKPQKPQAAEEKGGALAVRPTTALLPSAPTGIVPNAGGALATIGDSGGAGGGTSAQEIALNISSKIIRIDKLLAGSLTIKKNAREQERIAREQASKKKQEAALEKAKPKDAKGLKLKLPGKSLLERIFGFFGAVILGRIAFLAVDWLPKLLPIIDTLGKWADNVVKWGGMLLDGLTRFIDFSYKLYDSAVGWIKDNIGEEGAEKFQTFMGNVKELVKAFLVWKLIGEKIFKAIVSSIRNVWSVIRGAIVKVAKLARGAFNLAWKGINKLTGGGASKLVKGVASGTKGLLRRGGVKARRLIGRGGRQLLKRSGSVVKGVQKGASSLMKKGVGGLAKRASLKFFGKAATKMFGKIPIFGPLIVGIVSLLSGEPIGQALFKAVGGALGGLLGSFIPIPFLGTILGETIGVFVGDLLYYTIIKKQPEKAMELLKGALTNILKGGKAVLDWIGSGFSRFFKSFFVDHALDIEEGGGRWAAMTWIARAFGMFDWLKSIGYVKDQNGEWVNKFPNLLQLLNPLEMGPLLLKSFFPPGGSEEKSSSAAGAGAGGGSGGSSDKGLEKQEKELIAANQKSGYDGVMKKIESYAPYEKEAIAESKVVRVNASGSNSNQLSGGQQGPPQVITVGSGGSGDDPYEVLDAFG